MTPNQISRAYHLLAQYQVTMKTMDWVLTQDLIPVRLGAPETDEWAKVTIHIPAPNMLEMLSAVADKCKEELHTLDVELL
jgi:hypothetical protein